MNKTTLVIMAAGMGSRYGGGIKQLEKVGPFGEIIMDYSIYDAKAAGFDKVVFITRRDLEKEFREIIGNRVEKKIETQYVFQELDNLPEGFTVPDGRAKPWGTGQAVLCCKDVVNEPFAVINADDYYGKQAFQEIYNQLTSQGELPACVKSCAAGARFYGDLDDPNSDVSKELAKYSDDQIHTLQDVGNHPATHYIMTDMVGTWYPRIKAPEYPRTDAYPVDGE